MEWKNIWRGMAMGTSDLIPGVSGGTIAVILGSTINSSKRLAAFLADIGRSILGS